MGNKLDYQERWQDVKFTHTRLPDVNDFCKEILVYNIKINKIRDALLSAEENMILYLGLIDIETLSKKGYKLNLKDVTLAIFFSFNAYFRGELFRMLNLKLSDQPPFFEINIHYLNPILKDVWLQYQKYMTTLENTQNFCQALIKKYKAFYLDFYERYTEFLQELEHQRDLDQISKLHSNYEQIVRVGQNLGCVEKQIKEKYDLILDAISIIREGSEVIQTAVVCRVNKIKYPDECMAKIMQLKNVPYQEIYDHQEYKMNQQRNYERYLFVSNKYLPSKYQQPQEVYDDREYEEYLIKNYRDKNGVKTYQDKTKNNDADNVSDVNMKTTITSNMGQDRQITAKLGNVQPISTANNENGFISKIGNDSNTQPPPVTKSLFENVTKQPPKRKSIFKMLFS
ncbi:UNKNOWN [Stylonychia lemnae]|uniref:Uncharacterized protein n=1 Tax=Stylonychia lemnae TaxID=5949 RepID=A0A078AI09_STYLE|nr:UNKNOWN [Stylonychia lemnae]|eukprot:CDW81875.1 UNKNOWN [Stylonychia lemnae]